MPTTRRFGETFYLIVFLNVAFVLLGAITTLLGVILPNLSARLALKDSESGLLFTVQFGAAIVATYFSDRLCKRIGFIPTLLIGFVFLAVAIAGLNRFDWNGVVLCVASLGFGIGLAIPTTNLLLTNLSGDKTASALNLLNFCYGLGALLCPTFVKIIGGDAGVGLPLNCFSVALSVCAVILLGFVLTGESPAVRTFEEANKKAGNFWNYKYFYICLFLFLFAVGIESGVTSWLPTFAVRLQTSDYGFLTPMPTVFWSAFMGGRIIAPFCLPHFTKNNFMLICLIVAAVGAFLFVSATDITLVTFGIGLLGLGISPIFPTALAQFVKFFGRNANSGAKWLFLSGSFGGASATWLIGFLSSVFGSLQKGLFVIPIIIVLMIGLQILNKLDAKNYESHD
ncbi:MAG: MFS transporter [Pyrinomonadaceae bacterium]|nr:MFS transporter [Pyrinomonadaceae bacterium]